MNCGNIEIYLKTTVRECLKGPLVVSLAVLSVPPLVCLSPWWFCLLARRPCFGGVVYWPVISYERTVLELEKPQPDAMLVTLTVFVAT